MISQRNSAVPRPPVDWGADARPAIAPDNLDSFARDLRALRGQAGLDYPELAQRSHYTMRTLASAAGGLRLPTLPVISAYVRACGGNVEEWEDRWHKIAKAIEEKRDREQPLELAQGPEGDRALPAPPGSAPTPRQGPSTVYVITSATPRRPDRLSASARHRLGGIETCRAPLLPVAKPAGAERNSSRTGRQATAVSSPIPPDLPTAPSGDGFGVVTFLILEK